MTYIKIATTYEEYSRNEGTDRCGINRHVAMRMAKKWERENGEVVMGFWASDNDDSEPTIYYATGV